MTVLQIRLEGPMQSWGFHSRFTERDTGREPTKSGIIGLLCSAMGRNRDKPLDDLSSLKMAVRVDREGIMSKDFHTALDVPKANNPRSTATVVSNRFFLADACFLVALEGGSGLLSELKAAIANPKWSIYLGRKSFVPSAPLLFPGCEMGSSLGESLVSTPWLGRDHGTPPLRLRVVEECEFPNGEQRMDVPLSFHDRTFNPRYVKVHWINMKDLPGWDNRVSFEA